MPLAASFLACGKTGPSCSTIVFFETFRYHGSLPLAVASPETLAQPIPVAPTAAALAQPAARALAVPLSVAVAAATAAALAEPAAAPVAVALAETALAEPAPPHATTTSATTTKKSRRAGQPPLRGQSQF